MKHLIIIIPLIIFLNSCQDNSKTEANNETTVTDSIPMDLSDAEESLLNDLRTMFEKNDVSVMFDRVHKDGLDNFGLSVSKDYLKSVLEGGLGCIELLRVDPPQKERIGHDGEVTYWSLPLKWDLVIHQPSNVEGMNISHGIPLSATNNQIVIIRELTEPSETRKTTKSNQ
jgi:hypothetical protein